MSEIAVDLRLKLEKLKQDAAQAGKDVSSGLASSVKGLGRTAIEDEDEEKARAARRATIARRNRNARLDAEDERRLTAVDVEGATRRNRARALLRQREDDKQRRTLEDERRAREEQKAKMLAFTKVLIEVYAAFKLLQVSIRGVVSAADEARRMYARALQSGMGLALTTRRTQLAEIIGVSEDEVWQYGAAVAFLNSKLDWSNKIFTDTTPVLTNLGWQFKILTQDMKAMWAQMVSDAAPAILAMTGALDKLAKENVISEGVRLTARYNAASRFASTFPEGTVNGDLDKNQPTGIRFSRRNGDFSAKVQSELQKQFQKFLGQERAAISAPSPVSFMKQLPASNWERMGLVVGGGGGVNYNKKTADNTGRANMILEQIATKIAAQAGINALGVTIPSLL